MSFTPEEESFAAEFLRQNQTRPTVSHTVGQLDHVETQLAKSQAGLAGEGEIQTIKYGVRDIRLPLLPEITMKLAVGKQFINGMVNVSKYLRRNVR